MRFSERTDLGLERHYDFMYSPLKNALWNIICIHFRLGAPKIFPDARDAELFMSINLFFGDKYENVPFGFQECVRTLKGEFFSLSWYEMLDFIEFLAEKNGHIEHRINQALVMDQFPYIMRDGKFYPRNVAADAAKGAEMPQVAHRETYQ